MATVTLTFSDSIATRVVNALAFKFGYTDTVPSDPNDLMSPPIPNPETKAAFVKRNVAQLLRHMVIQAEAQQAALAADTAARLAGDTEIIIT